MATLLFNHELLNKLGFEDLEGIVFSPSVTPSNPGENLIMRPLERTDYAKGYITLLSQLTKVGEVTQKDFESRFDEMLACAGTYYVFVVEDVKAKKIISSATVTLEKKFIHSCALRGRIEDVVVDENCRGKQLGKLMVLTAKKLARELGCYKLTLDCEQSKIPFYKKFGLNNEECFFMVHRF